MGTSLCGWAPAMQGRGKEGIVQVRQGSAARRATGEAVFVPNLCTFLAGVSACLDLTEDSLQALIESQTLVEQHEERVSEAEVHRLRDVLLLKRPGAT